mmetsp:Transcript_32900/g.79593  ORF Transcript_32900/g.79593 Transcript_32900/m.79593 type:complete len:182 (-) Transcript_32900:359-904(-)
MENETALNATMTQAGLNDTDLLNETIGDLHKQDDNSSGFEWTALTIAQAILLFFLAGAAEIVGGWMVWMHVRGGGGEKSDASSVVVDTNITTTTTSTNDSNVGKPWWWGLVGSIVLVIYGFIPCLQPTDSFGRIYAAYGGFFIVFSFLFGWAVDGDKPDIGDVIGGCICFIGAGIIFFWPR